MNYRRMPEKPEKGSHFLRKGRRSFFYKVYFVSAFKDRSIVRLDDHVCFDSVMESLDKLEKEDLLEWFALVVMPDHFHIILRLGENITLSKLMQRLKGSSSYEINRRLGRKGSVWYKGYYDRMIRDHEDVLQYLKYLYENPVRKGLVEEASEWKFTKIKWEQFS